MKSMKGSLLRMSGAVLLGSLLLSMPVYAAGKWKRGSGSNASKWWYEFQDKSYAKNGWYWIDGDADGVSEYYYFDKNGWMLSSQTVEGKQLNANGAWIEDGTVKKKTESTTAVSAGSTVAESSPEGEFSSGTIELGSDLALGTELELEVLEADQDAERYEAPSALLNISAAVSALGDGKEDAVRADGEAVFAEDPDSGSEKTVLNAVKTTQKEEQKDKTAVIAVSGGPGADSSGSKTKSSASGPSAGTAGFSGNVGRSSAELPRGSATELVEFSRTFIGVLPYVTAGNSLETGADCSGFTQQVFKHFGISIPRDSRSQYAASVKVSAEELKPGDMIFYGTPGGAPSSIRHVGIYSGNGTVIHSTHSGDYVRETDVFYGTPYGYGRFTG